MASAGEYYLFGGGGGKHEARWADHECFSGGINGATSGQEKRRDQKRENRGEGGGKSRQYLPLMAED